MRVTLLDKSLKVLLLFMLVLAVMHYAKPFLVPFLIASLLAMLLLPLSSRLERKMPRGLAILISMLLLLLVISVLGYIISTQVSELRSNAPEIEKNINEKIGQLKTWADRSLGISTQQQNKMIKEQQQSSSGKMSSLITGSVASFGGFLTNFIIVMVYVFLFQLYRDRFKKFVLKVVPVAARAETETVIHDVRKVAQKYLTGLALMIACLWVMYGIGFSIVGVKNAVFFAILCGLLEIVPFVGNLTGVGITLLVTLAQGGESKMLIGILITYGVVQFIQTYLLEPLVVGREISINPVFTIIALVAAELIWGIPGMVLALPLLGMAKIVCDHITPLKPYGQLIGEDRKESGGLSSKIKDIFKKK